jgi:hypothetical protein
VRATVRLIRSPDLEPGADGKVDGGPVPVEVYAGPPGGPEERFVVLAVTPSGLDALLGTQACIVGQHYLVVRSLDLDAIAAFLTLRITMLEADTWAELAPKIGRIGSREADGRRTP